MPQDGNNGCGTGCAIALVLVVGCFGILSLSDSPSDSSGNGDMSSSGEFSTSQDRRLDAALDDLARRCEESKTQLRRMINRAVEMKREEGVATSPTDLAEGLQTAVQGISPGECVDELSGLMVLMDHQ